MRYLLVYLLLFTTGLTMHSQTPKQFKSTIDSLNKTFLSAIQENPAYAKELALKIKKLSIENKDPENLALGNLNLGMISIRTGLYDTALAYYQLSLDYLNTKGERKLFAKACMGMGTAYNFIGKHDKALDYNYKALRVYENTQDKILTVRALANIGIIYEGQGQFEKALTVYQRCMEINRLTNDKTSIADAYGNIGQVYFRLRNYAEAIGNHKKEIAIWEQLGDSSSLCYAYDNISSAYAESGNLKEGLRYQQKALYIYEEFGDKPGTANSHCNLGIIYSMKDDPKKAEDHLLLATKIAEEIHSSLILKACYESLIEVYAKSKDYKKGFDYYEKYAVLIDTLYTIERSRQMADIEALYKNEKLSNEKLQVEKANIILSNEKLQTAEQRNYVTLTSVIFVLFLSGGFYIYIQRRKRTEEKERINTMLLSEEKERTRIARELHDGLGQLLSTARINAASLEDSVFKEDLGLLQNTLSLIDQSVTEVRAVSHNLMPQLLMEKGLTDAIKELTNSVNSSKTLKIRFNYSDFNLPLTKSIEVAVYRVIQEVLNNMIRHSSANQIEINLVNNKKDLRILISDNGKGFDTNLLEKSEGLGWKNIFTRLSLINGKFGVQSAPGKGTTVTIEVAT